MSASPNVSIDEALRLRPRPFGVCPCTMLGADVVRRLELREQRLLLQRVCPEKGMAAGQGEEQGRLWGLPWSLLHR